MGEGRVERLEGGGGPVVGALPEDKTGPVSRSVGATLCQCNRTRRHTHSYSLHHDRVDYMALFLPLLLSILSTSTTMATLLSDDDALNSTSPLMIVRRWWRWRWWRWRRQGADRGGYRYCVARGWRGVVGLQVRMRGRVRGRVRMGMGMAYRTLDMTGTGAAAAKLPAHVVDLVLVPSCTVPYSQSHRLRLRLRCVAVQSCCGHVHPPVVRPGLRLADKERG